MSKKKKKRLTARQKKFIQVLATGTKTQGQAAIAAGYSPKNANQSARQVMDSIRAKMPEVLERHGLTDDALIHEHLLPLLNAKIVRAFTHKGRVIYSKPLADNDTRRQTLDMTFKLKGSYAPKTEEEAHISQQFMGPTVIVLDLPRPKRPEQPTSESN
jgi:hypothetical protein